MRAIRYWAILSAILWGAAWGAPGEVGTEPPTTAPDESVVGPDVKPEDLLAGAQRAESAGEWDAAIQLYWLAAARSDDSAVRESAGIAGGDLCWLTGREGDALRLYKLAGGPEGKSVSALARQVHLSAYWAAVVKNKKSWGELVELAEKLAELAPADPLGPQIAAVARAALGGQDNRAKALAHLERFRRRAPNNPRGYLVAALLLRTGSDADRKQADELMAFTPDGATAAVRSRFRLARLGYRLAVLAGEGPDPETVRGKQVKLLQDQLPGVTDDSQMNSTELFQWARYAALAGQTEQAEKIYLSCKGLRRGLLAEVTDPPVRPAVIERLDRLEPRSVMAYVQLAGLSARAGKPEWVDRWVKLGLALPKVDRGLLGTIYTEHRYNLEKLRFRLLFGGAVAGAAEGWTKVKAALEEVAAAYPGHVAADPEFHHLAGLAAYSLNDRAAAVRELGTAVALLDKQPGEQGGERRTVMLLADLYLEMSWPKRTDELLARELKDHPGWAKLPVVQLMQARSAAALDRLEQAADLCDRILGDPELKDEAIRHDATRLRAYCRRRLAEQRLNQLAKTDPAAAIRQREAIARDEPDNWDNVRALAGLFFARPADRKKGEQLVDRYLQAHPDDVRAIAVLIDRMNQLGRPAEAETYLRRARKLDPKSPVFAASLGQVLARQGKWQQIVDESAGWIKDAGPSVRLCMIRAAALKQLGRNDEMREALDQAVDVCDGQPDIVAALAAELPTSLGEGQAEKWLDGCVQRHADRIGPRLVRAQFRARHGKIAQAVADLKALAGQFPAGEEGVNVRFNLALALQQSGRSREAAEAFQEVIKLAGDNVSVVVLNNYAYLLADDLDRAAEAVPFAEKAAEMTGRADPSILDTLGWVYHKAGRTGDAIALLEQALAMSRSPVACYHLAAALKAAGQLDQARGRARQAVELFGPDSKEADADRARRLLKELGAGAPTPIPQTMPETSP